MRSGAAVKSVPRPCAPEGARSRGGVGPRALRLAALLSLLLSAHAHAGPRSIDDCEAIKEASAYNLCLASFGPVRGQHGASYPGVAAEGEKRSAAGKAAAGKSATTRRAGAALGYRGSVSRSHGGRIRMEFTPARR